MLHQRSGESVYKLRTTDRSLFGNWKLYVRVMGKLSSSGQRRAKSTMTLSINQVDLFLCLESCNDSTAKGAAAQGGGAGEWNERIAGAFSRRLGKVG